jgi:spore coat polysaccharide biosynthesis predicted glycosyltransferase SpsG
MDDGDATVVLHAAGGGQLGVGHLARTAALCQAMLAGGGWRRVTLLWQCDIALARRFRPGDADCLLAGDWRNVVTLLNELAQRGRPALLASDLFEPPLDYFALARRLGFAAVAHLNDSGEGRGEADLLVDSDAFKSDANAPPGYRGAALIGAPYQILRAEIVRQRPPQPWTGAHAKRVLITFGGADPAALTSRFVRAALERVREACTLSVVVGPSFSTEHRQELRALMGAGAPVELLETQADLTSLILQTDLVVCLGGVTAYETMCLGRPCAALAWEHLTPYVEGLAGAGLLADLGGAAELDRAADVFTRLVNDPERLHELAAAGWKRIDGQGAQRVASRLRRLIPNPDRPD